MATTPFEGIRVLDLATVMAGPVAATLLADFGGRALGADNAEVYGELGLDADAVNALRARGLI